jgi:tRNA1Val (adenine37-N6)-methyltransferase
LVEAQSNFNNSPFSDRILGIEVPLQDFGTIDKYDLIICNPPYYDGSYVGENEWRNNARHNLMMTVAELYEYASDLLSEDGRMNVIVPFTEETEHIERAFDNDLFIQDILHTLTPTGDRKRSLISFGHEDVDPIQETMLVKNENNAYSAEYIELTKAFYFKSL